MNLDDCKAAAELARELSDVVHTLKDVAHAVTPIAVEIDLRPEGPLSRLVVDKTAVLDLLTSHKARTQGQLLDLGVELGEKK